MDTRHSPCSCGRCLPGSHRASAPVSTVIAAMLFLFGLLASAAHGGPALDRKALSDAARDVVQRGANGSVLSEPEPAFPAGADVESNTAAPAAPAGDGPPAAHAAPAREGVTVPTPHSAARPIKGPAAAAGYESNSWRQKPAGRGLGFTSGALPPAVGLDPALAAQADGVRARGGSHVYGFLLLRVPADQAMEKKLAGVGVTLLGPHDDHVKARLPIASLRAIAALKEVEWVGVSAARQKLSPELTVLRARGAATAVDASTPLPIVVNLFEGDTGGAFRRQLEAAGATVASYDADLHLYRAVATERVVDQITALDFVLFVELIGTTSGAHDQSMPMIDADIIRPGAPNGHTRFGASTIPIGIMDTGSAIGAGGHGDLSSKKGCGLNFTADTAGAFVDQNGHGTHVLGTIAGTGAGNARYKGVATEAGNVAGIRVAKIWGITNTGQTSWMDEAIDWMALAYECNLEAPYLINISGGSAGNGLNGTDALSRKLDYRVWINAQLYVVAAGNEGPTTQTIRAPGVAKNALTVGSVVDTNYQSVGDVAVSSSRGPTGDGRMKPNIAAPGQFVTSAKAGTTNDYTPLFGTSMAAPHVTGLAATLMDHYDDFIFKPALVRAHLMSTAIAHENLPGKSNDYGLGRVSGYVAHWNHTNSSGWETHRFWGKINSGGYQAGEIVVPPNTKRLVIVLTWDEPPASAGATRAVTYDLDLWVDKDVDCTEPQGYCGEWNSVSTVDNVEYVVVDNPPAGVYRLKALPYSVNGITLPYGMVATIIRGHTSPAVSAYMTAPENPTVGSTFGVTLSAATLSYVASGFQVEPIALPLGVTPLYVETTRHDGVTMRFSDALGSLTLGNLVPILGRSATWYFRADSPGQKQFWMRGWWENNGEFTVQTVVDVKPGAQPFADLTQTGLTLNPPAPQRAPGTTFSVTDTVMNVGNLKAPGSTTRFYLSADAAKSAGDVQLTGSHAAGGLEPGASHTATVTLTIPATTPAGAYYLIACADAQNAIVEMSEDNNCTPTPSAVVTVALPDLTETVVTANPATPVRAPGTTFSVTDTVRNAGPVAAAASSTRYYLSLDAVRGAGDTLVTGTRAVPIVAAGAVHTGTLNLTIPAATPLGAYYLLACADDLAKVGESNEANNCVATATAAVTVTRPDLAATAVGAPPATKKRGTVFAMSDTTQNLGTVQAAGSATRYYLSLDQVKSASDVVLTGARSVPALAAGASHFGTINVTIPANVAPNTYYVLACADGAGTVVEVDEANNCRASATTVVVTP